MKSAIPEVRKCVQNSDVHVYFRKCDVLNRGLSGYNTRWAKIVLPRLIHKDSSTENTVAVTIFFGANDSALKGRACFLLLFLVIELKASACFTLPILGFYWM